VSERQQQQQQSNPNFFREIRTYKLETRRKPKNGSGKGRKLRSRERFALLGRSGVATDDVVGTIRKFLTRRFVSMQGMKSDEISEMITNANG
jgi:hypothetical protein